MRQITKYGKNHVYILANDDVANRIITSSLDAFMKDRNENESYIFISYHVKEDLILIHLKKIENETDFNSAIQLIKEDIQNGNLHSDDTKLKKLLKNSQATTSEFLLNYIASEEM